MNSQTRAKSRRKDQSQQVTTTRPSRFDARRIRLIVLFLAITIGGIVAIKLASIPHKETKFGYQEVDSYPHDSKSFTQGLLYLDGKLYESTGLDRDDPNSKSQLKIVDLKSGAVEKEITLEADVFGEGLTMLDGKLYQLTWRDNKVFVYDKNLNLLNTFDYPNEGWGLTNDGKRLILSDGTSVLKFIDPKTFEVVSTLVVRQRNFRLRDLNELEFIDGYIYANVWHADFIAKISPASGKVVATIDLSGIHKHGREDVLNGIAYDPDSGNWFVTGKLWPKVHEIKVVKK